MTEQANGGGVLPPPSTGKRLRSFSEDGGFVAGGGATQHQQWIERFRSSVTPARQYVVFCAEPFIDMALRMQSAWPDRFRYCPIHWEKFPDGTDNITITGFTPLNVVSGSHVLFLASFHSNDVTLSIFSVLIVLLQSFIESLTIALPFYPVGTNERVESEGKVATANTYSMLLSNLPTVGCPNRIMLYDLHTLQNRFYFHSSTIPSMHSSVPLLFHRLRASKITAVVFPDDGAAKRFSSAFKSQGFEVIVCGKVRDGDKRIVTVQDGDPRGLEVIIVDDLVQSGGTIYECAVVMRSRGATLVSAFVAHGVFPNNCWRHFLRGGARAVFDKFYVTNSIPSVVSAIPTNDVFEVLDLLPLMVKDLDSLSGNRP